MLQRQRLSRSVEHAVHGQAHGHSWEGLSQARKVSHWRGPFPYSQYWDRGQSAHPWAHQQWFPQVVRSGVHHQWFPPAWLRSLQLHRRQLHVVVLIQNWSLTLWFSSLAAEHLAWLFLPRQ